MTNDSATKKQKLCVKTKNCKKNIELTKCDNCRRNDQVTWHYKVSNRGPVNTCEKCKKAVLTRSFPYVDAMSRAIHSGHYGSRNKRQWY
jgi:hypothetical protein